MSRAGAVHVADDGGGVPRAGDVAARAATSREALADGRIIGHKCPECGEGLRAAARLLPAVRRPDRPRPTRSTSQPRGTITTFSVITPLQYQGQEEKEDYVQATILLDGSHSTLGMQRIDGIPIGDVHTGLRVAAVWRRRGGAQAVGAGSRRRATSALGEAISGWKPTGEPDAPLEQYADYIV